MRFQKIDLDNTTVRARFWQAIWRPPMLDINVKVGDIKRAVFEVVLEGNAELVRSHYKCVEVVKNECEETSSK